MSGLETIHGTNWGDLLAAPASLLVLGRSDSAASGMWAEELATFLESDETWSHVRFGYLQLDREGLDELERAHPWIAAVCEVPTNLLFLNGVKKKTWLGGVVKRLEERLASVRAPVS